MLDIRRTQLMNRKIALTMVLLSLVTVLAACAGQTTAPGPTQVPAAVPAQSTLAVDATTTPQSQQPPVLAPAPKPAGPIKAREITPTVTNGTVSIPLKVVQENWNNHFLVNAPAGTMGFMAYTLDNVIYVRASICPPCRGKTYALDGNILVCDTCGTTFNANTGVGIAGACVNYPKASVTYTVADGNLVMKVSDLTTAYQNTLKPGLP